MNRKFSILLIVVSSVLLACDNDPFSEIEEQFNMELAQIDQFLVDNNLTALALPTGVRITFLDTLSGSLPSRTQTIVMDYTSFLLDDQLSNVTIFDTSDADVARNNNIFDPTKNYSPEEFTQNAGGVIPAWEIAVPLLTEGSTAFIFSPSGLAYGKAGFPPLVPPDTPVGFFVKVVDIRN